MTRLKAVALDPRLLRVLVNSEILLFLSGASMISKEGSKLPLELA